MENHLLFEIACNEISSNDILVRSIRTPKVLLEIALRKVVSQFGHADLLEGQVQWQRFGSLLDRNAVLGQVAKSEESWSIRIPLIQLLVKQFNLINSQLIVEVENGIVFAGQRVTIDQFVFYAPKPDFSIVDQVHQVHHPVRAPVGD